MGYESILSCRLASFTVDTTGPLQVPMFAPGAAENEKLKWPGGEHLFQAKENILIKAVSVCLPYCFCLADDRISLWLRYHKESDDTGINLFELAGGFVWVYSENVEQELSAFWPWKANVANETSIYLSACLFGHIAPFNLAPPPATLPNVSMVNVPATFNGVTLPVYCFLRVIHNFPLGFPVP